MISYYPPPDIINLLNKVGLFHGTYSILPGMEHSFRKEFGEQVVSRWTENTCLSPFGGLYVTTSHIKAAYYAEGIAHKLNFAIWDVEPRSLSSVTYVKPEIYSMSLRDGIEIALDEDEFGWADLCQSGGMYTDLRFPVGRKKWQDPPGFQDWNLDLEEMIKELDSSGGHEEDNSDLPILRKWVDFWTREYCEVTITGMAGMAENELKRLSLRLLNSNFDVVTLGPSKQYEP